MYIAYVCFVVSTVHTHTHTHTRTYIRTYVLTHVCAHIHIRLALYNKPLSTADSQDWGAKPIYQIQAIFLLFDEFDELCLMRRDINPTVYDEYGVVFLGVCGLNLRFCALYLTCLLVVCCAIICITYVQPREVATVHTCGPVNPL
jgi:hypothetical protein